MNKILLTLAFMFSYVACIFAQGELPEETVDYAANFATFAGVVGCYSSRNRIYQETFQSRTFRMGTTDHLLGDRYRTWNVWLGIQSWNV